MKKILTIAFLLLFSIGFAQTKPFNKTYSKMSTVNSNREITETNDVSARAFFNYGGENRVKIYLNNAVLLFTQIGDAEEGKTKNGQPYQLIKVYEEETGDELYIQLFETDELRLLFNDLSSIELYN